MYTTLNMYSLEDDQVFQWENNWNNAMWGLLSAGDSNLLPFQTKNKNLTSDTVDTFKLRKISIKGGIKTVVDEDYKALTTSDVERVDGDTKSYWYYGALNEISGITDGDLVEYYLVINDKTFYSDPFCINTTQNPYRLFDEEFDEEFE